MSETFPRFRSIVLDTTDARRAGEFYRQLLGWDYLEGFEPPAPGLPDPRGADWVVVLPPDRAFRLAFQQVPSLPAATWPADGVPQQLHLDLQVRTGDELAAVHQRALDLGARVLDDRSTDPEERLYVYADPDGHPFCVFVSGEG